MKQGDTLIHKLTEEKVLLLRIYPEQSGKSEQLKIRLKDYSVISCYRWELKSST